MNAHAVATKIKESIDNITPSIETKESGEVVEVGDSIAHVSGLQGCGSMEMLEFETEGTRHMGIALNLGEDTIGAIILSDTHSIKEGTPVTRKGAVLSIPVGEGFLGRVIDPMGRPIDDQGDVVSAANYPVERIAPGVMAREPVNQPLQTGIKAIDAMIPIGRGQRELIIGDRQTGKTTIAIDTILNQKGRDVVCIYVAVGQKKSKVARIVDTLREKGAMDYTIVMLAGASDPASFSYIAPYAGTAMAEYFMDKGKDVLVVYDDLTKHAIAYRELSLILRRPPGREAFPGDVFYLHSRLLERSARRNSEHGGGSITALPIIETQAGDVSAYVPTNVISITDGQIFLESNLFHKGIRPAINIGLSVSRVGGSAQTKSIKKVAGKMKMAMAQFRELEAFSQFASDLDPETKRLLDRGARAVELTKQPQFSPLSVPLQTVSMFALNEGFFDEMPIANISIFEKAMHEYLSTGATELLSSIEKTWSEEIEQQLRDSIKAFTQSHGSQH